MAESRIPMSWVFLLSVLVIVSAIGSVVIMLFWIRFPSVFQYRIAVALICFSLSSIAGLLFTAKVQINGKLGALGWTVGGTAALWIVSMLVFNAIFPESQITSAAVYELRLNLLFPTDNAASPWRAKVSAYVQRHGETAPKEEHAVRVDKGAGGMVVNFDHVQAGDKLFVIAEDRGKGWRSDEMVVPTAHLKMNPAEDVQP